VGTEHGAATLIALALSAVVIVAALVAADLGALEVARAQAQTAADLAALAAVTPAGGGLAADRAREIAVANGADMTRCTCEPMEAVIGVRRRVLLAPFGMPVEVSAYARAVLPGPVALMPLSIHVPTLTPRARQPAWPVMGKEGCLQEERLNGQVHRCGPGPWRARCPVN
jgi:secretion/DNA translocation related TadE-like protein